MFKVIHKKVLVRVLVLAIVSIAALLIYLFLFTGNKVEYSEAEVITFSESYPDETVPDNSYKWRGMPYDPKKIIIPSIKVEGFVQNVGVDQNEEVAVPNNIHKAGWFVDSVLPGNKGLSIIDGHVDGNTQSDGIFQNLSKVKTGETISIIFGDNSEKIFEIFKIVQVKETEAASELFSQDPSETNQLNLITCVGKYDTSTRRYDQRYIVSARLAN